MADGASLTSATAPREKLFTVAEFDRMAAAGLLDEPGRHELWAGKIMMAPPPDKPHMDAEQKHVEALILAIHSAGMRGGFRVFSGGGFLLNESDLRGPDVMVLTAAGAAKAGRPTGEDVALLIEIADSSLAADLGPKRDAYAAAGVAEYWVADVEGRVIHVFRGPKDGAFASQNIVPVGEAVSPLFAPSLAFPVADLL